MLTSKKLQRISRKLSYLDIACFMDFCFVLSGGVFRLLKIYNIMMQKNQRERLVAQYQFKNDEEQRSGT